MCSVMYRFALPCVLLFSGLSASCSDRELSRDLAAALRSEDAVAIQRVVDSASERLGDEAGEPEVADVYAPVAASARALSPVEVQQAMAPHYDRAQRQAFWQIGVDPTTLVAPLRAPAAVLACMLAVERAQLAGYERALPMAKEAADFLMWAQEEAGAGCYPFPAARHTSEDQAMKVGTRFLERAEAAGKLAETVRNGWAFHDHGDGGLQFDNGECGVAMFEYYERTREEIALVSAVRSAEWAMKQPLCPNWNYNAFSVALLAKAHEVTKEQRFLDAAVKKALLGVMPGQLKSGPKAGRWMDPHNARPAYHYIMLGALTRLAAELPSATPERDEVMNALRRGLVARNREIIEQGVMSKDKPIECLLVVHRLLGRDAPFMSETQSAEALEVLIRFVSEQAREGRLPLGPRGWGEMLEHLAAEAGSQG
jgi:hypothetical protein